MRFHDAADLTQALDELPALPLAVSSISAAGDRALATSLDGTAALIDTADKKILARVETGRVPPKAGENGGYFLVAEGTGRWEFRERALVSRERGTGCAQ